MLQAPEKDIIRVLSVATGTSKRSFVNADAAVISPGRMVSRW